MNGGDHVTAAPPDQLFLTDCQQAISPFKKTQIIDEEKTQKRTKYQLTLHCIATAIVYSLNKDRFELQKLTFWRFLWMRTAICKWVWLRKIWRPQPAVPDTALIIQHAELNASQSTNDFFLNLDNYTSTYFWPGTTNSQPYYEIKTLCNLDEEYKTVGSMLQRAQKDVFFNRYHVYISPSCYVVLIFIPDQDIGTINQHYPKQDLISYWFKWRS